LKSSKKCLIIRLGAYGDMCMITPVLRRLKQLEFHVILNTGKRGLAVLRHDPHIDEFIEHPDRHFESWELSELWNKHREGIKPDKFINFSESIECNVAVHPLDPLYIYPKWERYKHCNKNYYEVTWNWAKKEISRLGEPESLRPSLFFTKEEEKEAGSYVKEGKFNVLWQLSGSGKQKVYPWTDFVMGECFKKYPDKFHFITTGDERCKLLESFNQGDVTNLSGEVDIRIAMLLTKYVDLVISPDTGILHASGVYDTPKIGLLGHTTRENITKHFINDYSLEAECACSPCFRLIYDFTIQCPLDPITTAAVCMNDGIPPERLYEVIEKVGLKTALK